MKLLFHFLYAIVLYIVVIRAVEKKLWSFEPPFGRENCTFVSYVPGKGRKVTGITAPVMESSNRVIVTILKYAQKGADTASSEIKKYVEGMKEVTDVVTKSMKTFNEVAPFLGPAFIILGFIAGQAVSSLELTPAEVMNQANKAIAKLTDEMNGKLDNLKQYVDDEIIQSDKIAITNFYVHRYSIMMDCLTEPTKDLSLECQRYAARDILNSQHIFAIFHDKLFEKTNFEKVKDLKRLEAFLGPFKHYADMVIISLTTLMRAYANDTSEIGRIYHQKYTQLLKEKADFFIKYAKAAVQAITDEHRRWVLKSCKDTYRILSTEPSEEGWIWKNSPKYLLSYGQCKIDPFTGQTCSMKIKVGSDKNPTFKYNHLRYSQNFSRDLDSLGVRDELLHDYFHNYESSEAKKYVNAQEPMLKVYWQRELLDAVPVWSEVLKSATAGEGDEESGDGTNGSDSEQ